ncbi:MAG: hypothetical protein CMJ32_08180 [Phycisphaerae bacterium]|nr:hypothetical protein [Phycisphaerae bacterium]
MSAGLERLVQDESVRSITVDHPLEAMVQVCLFEKERATRSDWGTPGLTRTVLIITDDQRWADLTDLYNAIRKHMCDVAIWSCHDDMAVEILPGRAVEDEPSEPVMDQPEIEGVGSVEEYGSLKLTGELEPEPEAESAVGVCQPPDDDGDGPTVTEAEIAMLLELLDGDSTKDDAGLEDAGQDDPWTLKDEPGTGNDT